MGPPATDALTAEARRHHAFVAADESYQRLFRLRQARWRVAAGLPLGDHRGAPLGSRLPMPYAKETLANFLTENIRGVVRAEVLERASGGGKLYGQPRIFNDLLSSQPLCFNLFGELACDLPLAGRVFSALTGGRVADVVAVAFEHSPGRGDARYTGDRSAFDVFVSYRTSAGTHGFLGIEVKYHERLTDRPGEHRARYDELAAAMGCFAPEAGPRLRERPLQQLWRDHLLAGSLLTAADSDYEHGAFIVLYPSENVRCAEAVLAYRACLAPGCDTFVPWTLEAVVAAAREAGAGEWIDAFATRYLGAADDAAAQSS